eukprot:COSAG06_NODE_59649_length_273_cov_1.022989_1_plen_21_part_10
MSSTVSSASIYCRDRRTLRRF